MNPKLKTLFFFLVGAFAGILTMYLISNYKIEKKSDAEIRKTEVAQSGITVKQDDNPNILSDNGLDFKIVEYATIGQLTEDNSVISYVKSNHKLPNYYITKSEAKSKGWNPSKGNLCDVLPGKAIGGDKFSNREKKLPKGEQYYEADVNYNCGNRGADRIVFTKNGDVWLTKNHYKSFEKQ
ncbi:ribonuclease domain-containing protein [Epilithonimonas zeae]|uniref:ribonuclease domain-containing protein n=1 Tax=Epilithonimonas zeae TaxID=1416779 RepID=UPI00200EFB8A|nr:ribonuclease domain-containing protein [Epilithonimonas zeae]UQB67209.1 ribonuclease N [Epilithonimonas zeae]